MRRDGACSSAWRVAVPEVCRAASACACASCACTLTPVLSWPGMHRKLHLHTTPSAHPCNFACCLTRVLCSPRTFALSTILLAPPAGINVAGAIQVARALGQGHTIVTMLCDRADRYATKLYNPGFLQAKGLPTPPWLLAPDGEGAGAVSDALAAALGGG